MDLEVATRELVDRQEITELIHAYCERFDRNDPAGVAALFTADATIDYNPDDEVISGAEIEGVVAKGLANTFAATSHLVGNVSIVFEDRDNARSLCYLDAWHRYHDGSPDGYLWGRYLHRFRRTEAGWRITGLTLQAAGTVDFHRVRMHGIGRA